MSSLTCTDEMYLAFMASMGQANFQNEAVKDWIKNGIEAAIAAMPVEVAAWRYQPKDGIRYPAYTERENQALAYDENPVPLFTHPDANITGRLIERQLRLFAHALKGMCKDFSDLQNRPYMGDVTAAVDGLLEQQVESLDIDPKCKPIAMTGKRFARMALGLPYRDVESQARLVADEAAERINLLNGVGAPKPAPEQPLRYEARLRGREKWEAVSEAEARGYQKNLALYEVRVLKDSYDPTRMTPERYRQLRNGEDKLTVEERAAGWFFDDEYDGLLANRRWPWHEGF